MRVALKLQSLGDYPKLRDRDQEAAADINYPRRYNRLCPSSARNVTTVAAAVQRPKKR